MFFRDRRDDEKSESKGYPLLPLRDVVVFPHTPISLVVGRSGSRAAVEAANRGDREILLVAQREAATAEPGAGELFEYGTIATIEQTLNLPDGNTKVLVEARRRARIVVVVDRDGYRAAEVEELAEDVPVDAELKALMRTVKTTFERFVKLNRAVPPEMVLTVNVLDSPSRLADILIAPLQFRFDERQELLETVDVRLRLERVYRSLLAEIEFLQVEKKLKKRASRDGETSRREQWLGEQMRNMQREMTEKDSRSETDELSDQLEAKVLPELVRTRARAELRKLSQMNLMSAEATVVRNYLDWILALPWVEVAGRTTSIDDASAILDSDHYGLREVKERILEYIAVESLVEKMRGPILCLVGPPGVGKTSLARSIARATGRPFVRISLGGVRDEAEIRGHRRTYIGAMPGKLVHAMKRAGAVDPVMLLDEIDKMSSDFRGDPAAALLEVLDPEQNETFGDHYLDLDYDLSRATFVCTANTLGGIPIALRDRLEVIELTGYTEQEKLAIAVKYLVSKQRELHGLAEDQLVFTNRALLELTRGYTRESGVRELDRQIACICRKVARHVVQNDADSAIRVTSGLLERLLGPTKFDHGNREEEDTVGLVQGLAVSVGGGSLLQIEVAAVPGTGKLTVTGRPGDMLRESATAALTYLRSRAEAFKLEPDFYEHLDVHIHYPGMPGGVEGPSAGIAMAVSLVSAVTGIPVRADTAMTGEISLRGRVLPVGGLKEKVLAAHRAGVSRVLVPERNFKDVPKVPARVRETIEIIAVSHMDRVLKEALSAVESADLFASYGTDRPLAVDSTQVARPTETTLQGE